MLFWVFPSEWFLLNIPCERPRLHPELYCQRNSDDDDDDDHCFEGSAFLCMLPSIEWRLPLLHKLNRLCRGATGVMPASSFELSSRIVCVFLGVLVSVNGGGAMEGIRFIFRGHLFVVEDDSMASTRRRGLRVEVVVEACIL